MQHVLSPDGTPIAYYHSGVGRPLLLVHGTTADHTRWDSILPRFEPHFTVYTIDRRGRGGSGDAPHYSLFREAEDLAAVVEAIGEPVTLLGHSHGALCSLEAGLLTGKVSRLLLYEPPVPLGQPMYPPGIPDRMQALIDRGELEAALEIFFHEVVRMPDREFAVFRTRPVWKTRISLAPTIPRELTLDRSYTFDPHRFAGLAVPTLILLGGDSPPIFSQAAKALQAALPNCSLVVLPGQQHIAMDTAPDLFAGEVLKFLQAN